ncbi:MAG: hypothetical protein ACW96X_10740 [Promethearchaeota archaeon]|jgi:hypothetical protein
MVRIHSDHFALLIFGQGLWKESFARKISKDTKSSFFHLSGYTKDSLFCTCPICNALIKLFDPRNPDEHVDLCGLCIPLFQKFERMKGSNEGMVFLSHNAILEAGLLKDLTNNLLANDKIKKIYILEVEYKKIEKEIPLIIDELKHQRLPKSEFISLLENKLYNYRVIYEIFKDQYF